MFSSLAKGCALRHLVFLGLKGIDSDFLLLVPKLSKAWVNCGVLSESSTFSINYKSLDP